MQFSRQQQPFNACFDFVLSNSNKFPAVSDKQSDGYAHIYLKSCNYCETWRDIILLQNREGRREH